MRRYNPRVTLRMLRAIISAGLSYGLATESLVADQMVDLLGNVLAEEGGTLAEDADMRADFLFSVDAFLNVGWPRAIDLALRIETLFR